MLCFAEEKDPRKCLNEGKEVTRCGIDFYQKVREHCAEEFTKYWKCVDYGSFDMSLRRLVAFHSFIICIALVAD